MKHLNNRGITTVELLLCFVIVMIMAMTMYGAVSTFNEKRVIEQYKEKVYTYKELVTKEIQTDLVRTGVVEATYNEDMIATVSPSYANAPVGTVVHIVKCRLSDGTSRELKIYKGLKEADNRGNTDDGTDEDFFLIEYGEPGSLIQYPLPDLGDSLAFNNDESKGKVKDLIINNVKIKIEDESSLSIYIGFYHPELSTKYAINILCPINYFSDKFSDPIFVENNGDTEQLTGTYVSRYGSDSNDGTLAHPFATLRKAYEASGPIDTIYIMTDIDQDNTFVLDADKNITIRSCTTTGELTTGPHSIVRGDSLTTSMVSINTGVVDFTNVVFDGNDVIAQEAMIVAKTTLNLNDGVVLTKGANDNFGGALYIESGAVVNITSPNVTISHNHAKKGGGIFSKLNSSLYIDSVDISYNSSQTGGGIYTNGFVNIKDCKIYNNHSTSSGGGIQVSYDADKNGAGKLLFEGGSIYDNDSGNNGGGIDCNSSFSDNCFSEITITGGNLYNNTAVNHGGAISILGNGNISNATISANKATVGGGINFGGADSIGNLEVTNSIISNNSADGNGTDSNSGGGIKCAAVCKLGRVTISGNSSNVKGGGIYINAIGNLLLYDESVVKNNQAPTDAGVSAPGKYTNQNSFVCKNNIKNNGNDITAITDSHCN